jgi:predicted Rossmann fold nucleotide-binding protein DprA/Smf involved in DNA uptake
MSTKEEAKKRTNLLKSLREEHQDTVARTQAWLKEQKAVRKQLCQAIVDAAKTVPEIAELTGIPADQVLWHVTAMKKYDLVVEAGMCDEYYQYQMAEDKRK